MDLRQLRHVHVLARAGSFVRAAEELHITQPALTRSVQQLEHELRIKIFDRGRAGVRVTPVGRLLIDRAADILSAVRGLQADLGAAGRGEAGVVSLGLGPLPASIFLAELLTEMVRKHPAVRVNVETNTATALFESLNAERIEFCVCSLTLVPVTRKVTLRPIAVVPLALYARAQHPLHARRRATLADVLSYPLITGNMPAAALEGLREQAGVAAGEHMPIAVSCDDFLVLKEVTLNSDAVWLTSRLPVVKERAALIELKTTLKLPTTEIVAVSLASRSLSPAAELVLSKLTAKAARLGLRQQ